ncbi:MAG: serine/threonine protein kinase, partial [Burkholderiales bacterium]|nr:serine/threonine protein kinase [Burkholderiales bacterium]
ALTQVTSIVGTPVYMAPEQFLGRNVDRRADLYAAGALLYQLLVGRPPFVGSPESLMYRVVHEAPVLPSALAAHEHGARFDAVLVRALAKDPEQRYAHAGEFRKALVEVASAPVQSSLSDDTIVMVMEAPGGAGGVSVPSAATGSALDPAVLAQIESTLARHLGPMASVLVRRAARDCPDLNALYASLAEQVTHPAARSAILAQQGGASRAAVATRPPAAPSSSQSLPVVSDAFVAQSAKLLAQHLGPIASVVAKRAAARTRARKPFLDALEDALSDPVARAKLRAELERLV